VGPATSQDQTAASSEAASLQAAGRKDAAPEGAGVQSVRPAGQDSNNLALAELYYLLGLSLMEPGKTCSDARMARGLFWKAAGMGHEGAGRELSRLKEKDQGSCPVAARL
jgi:hypothetical protein